MTIPPATIDLQVEVPGSAETVWTAVATGPGISSWYVPHEVEERPGGSAQARFGPGDDMLVPGRVVEWDPPRRVVFAGAEGSEDGLTFEWTVEPLDGDDQRCSVRLVNGGFGEGGPWDAMYDAMVEGWRMFLSNLTLHLTHFAGQEAVAALPTATWEGSPADVWPRLMAKLGVTDDPQVGQPLSLCPDGAPALTGTVVDVGSTRLSLLLDEPLPGTGFIAAEGGGDESQVSIWTYRYGDHAAAVAEAEQDGWQAWLTARSGG